MVIHRIVNSVFNSCTYIVHEEDSRQALIVDCGDVAPIVDYLNKQELSLTHVLLTHSHYDHIYGLNDILSLYPSVKIITNEYGVKGLKDPRLNNSRYHTECEDFIFEGEDSILKSCLVEESLALCGMDVKVLATPGHDPSCLSYIIGNNLFTGDSYIPGIKVMATWPKSSKPQALANEERLKQYEREGYIICSGHWVG